MGDMCKNASKTISKSKKTHYYLIKNVKTQKTNSTCIGRKIIGATEVIGRGCLF